LLAILALIVHPTWNYGKIWPIHHRKKLDAILIVNRKDNSVGEHLLSWKITLHKHGTLILFNSFNTTRLPRNINAQVSRLINVVVQSGAVKIYVVEQHWRALTRKERQDETQFTTKIDGFLRWFYPQLNANVLFYRFFFLISPYV
jgi:hypothetical protein